MNCPMNDFAAVRTKDRGEGKDWRGSGTVLLVDDEEVVLEVVQRMLEGMGFQVVCVNGGREALEVFPRARGEIACVLLDLTMPQHRRRNRSFARSAACGPTPR